LPATRPHNTLDWNGLCPWRTIVSPTSTTEPRRLNNAPGTRATSQPAVLVEQQEPFFVPDKYATYDAAREAALVFVPEERLQS
jgi:hypothetical protein